MSLPEKNSLLISVGNLEAHANAMLTDASVMRLYIDLADQQEAHSAQQDIHLKSLQSKAGGAAQRGLMGVGAAYQVAIGGVIADED
jgi:hypothetical protein